MEEVLITNSISQLGLKHQLSSAVCVKISAGSSLGRDAREGFLLQALETWENSVIN